MKAGVSNLFFVSFQSDVVIYLKKQRTKRNNNNNKKGSKQKYVA